MTFDPLADLNWLAVLAAAIAYFAIGAIWYARPVFGGIWSGAGGFALPERGEGPGAAIFVTPLVGAVLASVALGMLAVATGTDTTAEGLALGVIVAIGFVASVSFVTAQFETQKPKPLLWGAVNFGYHAVGTLVAAIIIASWR